MGATNFAVSQMICNMLFLPLTKFAESNEKGRLFYLFCKKDLAALKEFRNYEVI